ncbi:translation initiation factor IF-2-like [Equus quagga]|uniref:translation initiation factor IF-2-like n=1 Tax=Equus quagga TaxID=89248 RepID=UPI001EE3326A|nr:translation initiation factor IF-2-like [Equus quagga]
MRSPSCGSKAYANRQNRHSYSRASPLPSAEKPGSPESQRFTWTTRPAGGARLAVTDPPAPPAQRDPPGAPAADTGTAGASPSAGARPGRGAAGLRDRAGRDNAEQTLPFGPTPRGAPPGPRQSLPLPAPARVHPSLSPGRSGPHRFQERALIRGPAARGAVWLHVNIPITDDCVTHFPCIDVIEPGNSVVSVRSCFLAHGDQLAGRIHF